MELFIADLPHTHKPISWRTLQCTIQEQEWPFPSGGFSTFGKWLKVSVVITSIPEGKTEHERTHREIVPRLLYGCSTG